MSRRIVTFEQFDSLMNVITAAGLENGDSAELTLRHVGIRPSLYGHPSLAFCPSVVHDLRILKRGNRDQHRLPFAPQLQLGVTLKQSVLRYAPHRGFLDIAVQVHASGVIELNGSIVRAEVVQDDFPVQSRVSYKNWRELISV